MVVETGNFMVLWRMVKIYRKSRTDSLDRNKIRSLNLTDLTPLEFFGSAQNVVVDAVDAVEGAATISTDLDDVSVEGEEGVEVFLKSRLDVLGFVGQPCSLRPLGKEFGHLKRSRSGEVSKNVVDPLEVLGLTEEVGAGATGVQLGLEGDQFSVEALNKSDRVFKGGR